MSEKEPMEIHHYDGIEEHDNPIPEWFSALFFGGLLFGMFYFSYYQLLGGKSLREEYDQAIAVQEGIRLDAESRAPKAGESELLALIPNPEAQRIAQGAFSSKCSACHGSQGQGGIGPNLADRYWIHGGKAAQIRDTIAAGVPDKGMPPWGGMLSVAELNSVSAYVYSLRNTKPPGAKAPQGVLEKE